MSDTDLAERLLDAALRTGAEAADVLVVAGAQDAVGVAGGALEEAERSESTDIGLRVLIGRRQACVAGSDIRRDSIAEMAQRAVTMARAAPEDPYCGLAPPELMAGAIAADTLDLVDPGAAQTVEALEQTALAAEAGALAVAGVAQVEQASAARGTETLTLMASNGFSGAYRRSSASIAVSAIAGSGLGRERDYAVEIRRRWSDLPDPGTIGRRAGERAVAALGPKKPRPGRYPVLYDERVAGSLIGHVLAAINGAAVARGASWLAEAMGTAILPEALTLTEDPLIPRGPASRPFDAEGLPAQRRDLVRAGVLESWVLDLATARQLELESTGNARRTTGTPPRPGTTNIRLSQGSESRADLIEAMGTGLVVTSLIGSSVNPTTGAYSRGASGFWVEGGEIVHPVNEITIAGSLPEMIRGLRAADDADPHRTISAPSLMVPELTVGA